MTAPPTAVGISERQALLGAGVVHLALLAALSIGWQMQREPLAAADEMIPVEIVEIAEAPRVVETPQPSIEAAPQDTAEPTPPEPAPPEPTPEPVAVPDAVPPPEAKPKPEPKPDKPAPAPKKPDAKPLDTSKLSNLIDKALPKAKTKPLDTSALASRIADAAPKTAQVDPRAAATLAQAIKAQLAPCWNPPLGGADVREMVVRLRADYAKDGAIVGSPSVLGQKGATAGNADYARAFSDAARRAMLRCSPLKLPPELYDLWKEADVGFSQEGIT